VKEGGIERGNLDIGGGKGRWHLAKWMKSGGMSFDVNV
jgi:hypothetical protein